MNKQNNAFHCLLDLLYPCLCAVCDKSLMTGERFICSGCLTDFPFSDDVFTPGGEILNTIEESCRPLAFHSLFYYSKYSDYKKLIYAVKYQSKKELGIYLGRMLGEKIKNKCNADCIIPVPLHKKKEKQRGFNQSYQIALGMAEVMGLKILNDVVCREQNNESQTGKDVWERIRNVENIFVLKSPQAICGSHVLLVDDVVTTGATVRACLNVLSEAEDVRSSLACLAYAKS